MINLLKADFRRYSRTKLLYIVALINLVLALFTILFTYWFVDESLLGEFTQGGYGYFLTALSPSNNGGLAHWHHYQRCRFPRVFLRDNSK